MRLLAGLAGLLVMGAAPAWAQTSDGRFDLGGQVTVLRLSALDVTDAGVGITATWPATSAVSLDGAFTWFPGDSGTVSRRIDEQQRVLGLLGVRSGIRIGRVELFGRARGGFLNFSAVDNLVCVALTTVPLPLECQIAAGHTAFAADVGGGASVALADRVRLRVEAGDLLVRYGLPSQRPNGDLTENFTSHNLQVSSGLTWRF